MKRSLHLWLVASLLLVLLIAGCAAQGVPPAQKAVQATRAAYALEGISSADAAMAPEAPAAGAVPRETGRKIILTANLQLTVKDTENTVAAIKGLVAAEGGFVASANVWREDNLVHAQLTLRVPADKMEPLIAEIKKLAIRVEREQSGGQDVTEEYVDLQAQLRNLEATEAELRELLKDVREKTGKAEDVMAVYRELTSVRGEIERIKGRVQYLDRSAELATISLMLTERGPEPIGSPGWQPLQTVRRALNALVQTLKLGADAAIWAVLYIVPLVGVPVFVIWLIWRLTRRRRARS